jgi:hypothetical protein
MSNLWDKIFIDVSDECYGEIRKKLIAIGSGGTFIETASCRMLVMGNVALRNGYKEEKNATAQIS